MKRLLHRLIAWLFPPTPRCPYQCPTHERAWRAWRTRKDRPGFRASDYR